MKARKIVVLDRYGRLTLVDLGGIPDPHTHTWSDISDAPEKDNLIQKGADGKIPSTVLPTSVVQTGADGKIPSNTLPASVVQKGSDGKIPTDTLPATVVQKGADGKLPADSLPGMGTGETPLVLGATNGIAGKFDRLATAPTASTNLRYNGNFRATKVFGVYFSDNADLAERYHIDGDWEYGDLICVCPDGSFKRNDIPENRRVLGFVSTAPGMVLGNDRPEDTPIALSGRVPVRAAGPVEPGDLLAAAPLAGCVWPVDPEQAPRGSIVAMALEAKTTLAPGLVLALVLRM